MVTVTSVPVPDRPAAKFTRSMTHPLRDPKAGNHCAKQGEPFDPAELSRRLEDYLAQQRFQSERRWAERKAAEAAAKKQEAFHYVPKVAAASFARTATPDALRKTHKLSEPALRQHFDGAPLNDPITGLPLTGLQRAQAMDEAMKRTETLRGRNQFQWNHDMEEAAEADVDRHINRPVQRTFETEFSHLMGRKVHKRTRPLSTGDLFSEDISTTTRRKSKPVHDVNDHRNDWVQRNEDEVENRRSMKGLVSPFLRKKDSRWILRGKKGKIKTEKDDAVSTSGLFSSPPDSGRISIGSFLARFKRHPS